MTTSLRRTFEERASATPWDDVERLVALGRSRVRRRRRCRALSLAVVAVAIPAGVTGVIANRGDTTVVPNDASPVLERGVSWAEGSVVHVGEEVIEVGETVVAYVVTDHAVVSVGEDGRVRVSDVDGSAVVGLTVRSDPDSRAGLLPRQLLAFDDAGGPYAAWFDQEAGSLVAYDTERGSISSLPSSAGASAEGPVVLDIDGDDLWVATDDGASALDLSDSGRVVATIELDEPDLLTPGYSFGGAAAGRVLVDAGRPGYQVRKRDESVVAALPGISDASLSPGGDYVEGAVKVGPGLSPVRTAILEVATGEEIELRTGYLRLDVDQWLDDDTIQVSGLSEVGSGELDFLTCEVPAGSCELAVDIGDPATIVRPGGYESGYVVGD